jgi:hypothetical protein
MKNKKIVFTFGRFNPPTVGHLLLATRVKQEASRRGADHIIYGSNSQDRKKNPLSARDKLRFMKKILKGFNIVISNTVITPFAVLDQLQKDGYTDIVMVVGADRVTEFKRGMGKYIGPKKKYKFKSFEVISAGERDPDSEGVSGMSASKMRSAASDGNLDAFQLGIPSHVSARDTEMLFKKVQTGMGVKPFVAESWFNYNEFLEFLEENDLKKFDMGGEGIDVPAIDNTAWGTEGIKKSAKKKKKVKIDIDEGNTVIPSSIAQDQRAMLGDAINATTNYLQYSHKKRATPNNIHTFRPATLSTAMQHLQQKRITGQHKGTYLRLRQAMGNIAADVEHEEGNELNELTIQARRKMAMSAKRTAKRRARKRKMKEKRKKSTGEIKKKAHKSAVLKIRGKMIKGMKWNELSYSQRESIGERLKKKKGAIQKLSKRLLPATQKAEQERLKRVRAKMTTNDPAKAVEKFEDINIDFENEILMEDKELRDKIAANDAQNKQKQEAKDKDPWNNVLIVRDNNEKIKLIPKGDYNPEKHTIEQGTVEGEDKNGRPIKDGRGKVDRGSAGNISADPDFQGTQTYRDLIGYEKEQTKKLGKASEEEKAKKAKAKDEAKGKKGDETKDGEGQPLETPVNPKVQAASDRAGIAGGDAEEAEAKVRTASAKQQLAQIEPQETDGSVASPEEIQKKTAKMAKQKLKHGAENKTDFKAVDVEAGVAAEFNRMQGHPDEIGNISSDNWKMLENSATLITSGVERYGIQEESAASRVIRDSIIPLIEELDPEGKIQWHMEHSGSGMEGLEASDHWKKNDATDATPKSDLVLVGINEKGERIEHGISVKAGPSQLLSPTPEEANAIITGVFGKMISHCSGKSTEECKSLLQSENVTKENIDKLVKLIMDHTKMRHQTGKGVGPFGWFTPGGKYNRKEGKPDYWDVYGPGSKCKKGDKDCPYSWESLEGTEPKPEHWKGTPADYKQNVIDMLHDSAEYREQLDEAMNEILNESKEFVLGLVHEAMTGCIKFCGCCDANCGCNSAVPTHYLTMSPDGSNSAIRKIDEQLLMDVAKETIFSFQLKSGGQKEMRDGKKQGTGKYKGYIAPRSQKRPKSKKPYASLNAGVQPFLKYSNIFIKEDMDMKDAERSFANDLRNPGDIEEREKEFKSVKGDPAKLLDVLGRKIDNVDTNEIPWQDIGMMKPSNKSTIVRIDGKKKRIPIMNFKEKEDMNEEFKLLTEPDILDRLVQQLMDKGMQKDQAYATATRSLQKNGVLKKGTQELTDKGETRNAMTPGERAKSREIKRSDKNRSFKDYTYSAKENTATLKDSYEFKDSSVHGMGSFASKDISENDMVGLYYLNLLNEDENAPQYQRTDFCRFTNHSKYTSNLALVEMRDGNFYTYATKDIKEGDEILIDYFHVFDTILPALKEAGAVIPEVLRWTDGYENMEIPYDGFGDLRDELAYFNAIDEAVNVATGRQEPELVTDSVVDTVKDKIDAFKFYTSLSQKELRKRKKKEKKKVKKYNKMVGISSEEVEFDKDTELEERRYDRLYNSGDIVKGRRGHHAGQKYVVHKGNDSPISDMVVNIGKNKVKVSPNNFNLVNRKELPEGAGAGDASASATDANRAAYLKQYGAKPEQRERRSARTNARNKLIRSGRASVGDGKDLDHKNGNPLDNSPKNLRMVNRSFNRGRDNNKWRKKTNEEHGAGEVGTDKLLKQYIKDTPFMKIIKDKNGK